ncbi:hypothetical protein GCM10027341_19360 [Spirosoma knui]
MKKAFTLVGCLLAVVAQAQSGGKISFRYDQRPTVSIDGRAMLNPWVGGLNATQYSTMRLNDDAREDLVVFDRTINKVHTFVAIDNPTGNGTAWQYAPEYEGAFPFVYSWMLLVDYDGDGRKDMFTYGTGTVRVFRNEGQNGQPVFRLVSDRLITEGFNGKLPLYVGGTDMPAITDYDGDGDIDIITFDPSGNLVAYQQNMSVETTGKKDISDFKRMGGLCWGHFTKEFCNDFTFGVQCDIGTGAGRVDPKPSGARPQHTGNTLMAIDANGDGTKDLLFGFVSCENTALLRNTGPNSEQANFTSFDSLYPAREPIRFPAFPATFWEDVDGDGLKDLLASPNVDLNDGLAYDFKASAWYYKNTGTNQKPDFQLVQKNFLQADMIDLGERAAPALADLDGDGDMDLLIGYSGTTVGKEYRAGIWHFENKGTLQNPAFALVTTDYLNISKTVALSNVVPSFADVDGNGSTDLVLTGNDGQRLDIRVLFNAAPKGAAVQYNLAGATKWPTPDRVQLSELPTVVDVDRDGKPDLLVGKSDGTIHYFRNAGTATAPVFQLQNQNFGGFTVGNSFDTKARSLVVADLNGDQKNELIAATQNGQVRVYQFPDRPDQSLTLLDSLASIGTPGLELIATAADLDGDQLPDLMLGSRTGGVRYLKNTSQKVVVTGVIEEPTGPWAFPNPTDRYLTVRPPYEGRLELISLSGQSMLPVQTVRNEAETVLDLSSVPDGTYILRLQADNRPAQVQKVVVWR